jgi:hypothetical protein
MKYNVEDHKVEAILPHVICNLIHPKVFTDSLNYGHIYITYKG